MEKIKNKIVIYSFLGKNGLGNLIFSHIFFCHYANKFNLKIYLRSRDYANIHLFDSSKMFNIIDNEFLIDKLNHHNSHCPFNNEKIIKIYDEYNKKFGDNVKIIFGLNFGKEQYGQSNLHFNNFLPMYNEFLFSQYSKREVKSYLKFSKLILNSEVYKYYESIKHTYIAAHVRRGDLITHKPRKIQLVSKDSFCKAIHKFGYANDTIVFVSDDTKCRTPLYDFKIKDGAFQEIQYEFTKNYIKQILPDFLKLIFAKAIFQSHSSFSYGAGLIGKYLYGAKTYIPIAKDKYGYNEISGHLEFTEDDTTFYWHNSKGIRIKTMEGGNKILRYRLINKSNLKMYGGNSDLVKIEGIVPDLYIPKDFALVGNSPILLHGNYTNIDNHKCVLRMCHFELNDDYFRSIHGKKCDITSLSFNIKSNMNKVTKHLDALKKIYETYPKMKIICTHGGIQFRDFLISKGFSPELIFYINHKNKNVCNFSLSKCLDKYNIPYDIQDKNNIRYSTFASGGMLLLLLMIQSDINVTTYGIGSKDGKYISYKSFCHLFYLFPTDTIPKETIQKFNEKKGNSSHHQHKHNIEYKIIYELVKKNIIKFGKPIVYF